MKAINLLHTALLALTFHSFGIEAAKKPDDSVLLSTVKTLTLRGDSKTSHRRVPAVPQVNIFGRLHEDVLTISKVKMHRWQRKRPL